MNKPNDGATTRPWYIHTKTSGVFQETGIAARASNGSHDWIGSLTGGINQEADRKLIVQAVNEREALLGALARLVLAWSRQPLNISGDSGERLEAMQNACNVLGASRGEPYSPSEEVKSALAKLRGVQTGGGK